MSLFLMARTVIKTLFRGPSTRRYPFGPRREFYKNTRGRVVNETAKCIFCGVCQSKCPTKAISVDKAGQRWKIDRLRCISCGYCTEVCPKKSLSMENQYTAPLTERKEEAYGNA